MVDGADGKSKSFKSKQIFVLHLCIISIMLFSGKENVAKHVAKVGNYSLENAIIQNLKMMANNVKETFKNIDNATIVPAICIYINMSGKFAGPNVFMVLHIKLLNVLMIKMRLFSTAIAPILNPTITATYALVGMVNMISS